VGDTLGSDLKISTTTDARAALAGAKYVITSIRVGGEDGRILDERIALRHGVLGQETTGPGGMMKALRTIPVMLELANDMTAACPEAWLINYTNPSGIMAEVLGNHTRVKYLSLCSGPAGWIGAVLRRMNVSLERANVEWIGLNHLGFLTRVWVDGVDATELAIEAAAQSWNVDPEWIRTLGAIPASYLRYFFHTGLVLEEYRQPGHQTRGEVVKEIEAELLRQYADLNLSEKPDLLRRRGGGGYSDVAIGAMKAIYHNTGERQVVQVLNGGAVEDLPGDASIEAACVVDKTGAHPLHYGSLPRPIRGLIQAVKAYESLTVQAAVEQSKRVALQAMMAHPLVPGWEVAKPLFEELLQANKRWIDWA
jgi:6-phospho-beta-glucosidase